MERMFEKYADKISNNVKQELSLQLSGLETRISSMESRFSAVESALGELDRLEGDLREIKKDVQELKNENLSHRLHKIESSSGASFQELVSEVRDRQERSANVIFFDVEEGAASTPFQASSTDAAFLEKAFADLNLSMSESVRDFQRIGKFRSSGAPRPVLVRLSSSETATQMLARNRVMNPKKYSISADKTIREREHLQELRNELKSRTDNGENDLTIRYVRGVPLITRLPPAQLAGPPPSMASKNGVGSQ
ncbi:unnamed protein product, partial [Nesidiocoris tenuis]